ncbi:dTDP-4-dehydrorhamnose 3,5-epimerase [Sporomusa sphaeroides]|uniref:dTDP-4-dehydrorhamnose 3,5-epimerase n=1 Tax=Sporomusa sphaeroides TaxID=47679 RepID=UPI002CC75338|nr:dTDP-4-dehydrorhamnose 3,5-epimerase [Sporomusa sphaeroides]HML34148.1 dTDP-4-dehydrorhamnose 3,5-epimerase [Sporomusa sphaeroides]
MKVIKTNLPDVLIIEPKVFGDSRGFFQETWQCERYRDIGITGNFVQDNLSLSARGVLRGLHYQHPYAQGKLVSVVQGEVFDVAVDIRLGSPTFGQWAGVSLSGENHRQLWIPPGFAHGFCVVSETAYFMYKCTELYTPETEGGIAWNDPDIGIVWPLKDVSLSEKDSRYPWLKDVNRGKLPGCIQDRVL